MALLPLEGAPCNSSCYTCVAAAEIPEELGSITDESCAKCVWGNEWWPCYGEALSWCLCQEPPSNATEVDAVDETLDLDSAQAFRADQGETEEEYGFVAAVSEPPASPAPIGGNQTLITYRCTWGDQWWRC